MRDDQVITVLSGFVGRSRATGSSRPKKVGRLVVQNRCLKQVLEGLGLLLAIHPLYLGRVVVYHPHFDIRESLYLPGHRVVQDRVDLEEYHPVTANHPDVLRFDCAQL